MSRQKLTGIQLADVLEKLDIAIEQAEQLRMQIGRRIRASGTVSRIPIRVPLSMNARPATHPVTRTPAKP